MMRWEKGENSQVKNVFSINVTEKALRIFFQKNFLEKGSALIFALPNKKGSLALPIAIGRFRAFRLAERVGGSKKALTFLGV